jgi:methyl-accepting chemotaxis protein
MDSGATEVELGSEKAAQAGQALDEILAAVHDTVRQVSEIASAAQQMAGGARSVTEALYSISAVFEQSSATTDPMAAQASQVSDSMQSIAAVSEQQTAATEQVSASTEQMSAQVEQTSAQAQELAHTAESLKELVALFKLHDPTPVPLDSCNGYDAKLHDPTPVPLDSCNGYDAAAPRRLRNDPDQVLGGSSATVTRVSEIAPQSAQAVWLWRLLNKQLTDEEKNERGGGA